MSSSEFDRYWYLFKGSYTKGTEAIKHILTSETLVDELFKSEGALGVLFGYDPTSNGVCDNDKEIYNLIMNSPFRDKAILAYLKFNSDISVTSMSSFLSSTTSYASKLAKNNSKMMSQMLQTYVDKNTYTLSTLAAVKNSAMKPYFLGKVLTSSGGSVKISDQTSSFKVVGYDNYSTTGFTLAPNASLVSSYSLSDANGIWFYPSANSATNTSGSDSSGYMASTPYTLCNNATFGGTLSSLIKTVTISCPYWINTNSSQTNMSTINRQLKLFLPSPTEVSTNLQYYAKSASNRTYSFAKNGWWLRGFGTRTSPAFVNGSTGTVSAEGNGNSLSYQEYRQLIPVFCI